MGAATPAPVAGCRIFSGPGPFHAAHPVACGRRYSRAAGTRQISAFDWPAAERPNVRLQILRSRAHLPDIARKPARDRKPVADHVDDRARRPPAAQQKGSKNAHVV